MTDPAQEIMLAARQAALPCFRSAWRGWAPEDKPPSCYAVFNLVRAPGIGADDEDLTQNVYCYLNVYGDRDIESPTTRFEDAAKALGWTTRFRRDLFDGDARLNTQALTLYKELERDG